MHAGAVVAGGDRRLEAAAGEPGANATPAVGGGDRTHHLVIPSAHQEAVATVARGLVAERPTERGVAAGEREAEATVLRRAVAFDPVPEPAEPVAVARVLRDRVAVAERPAAHEDVAAIARHVVPAGARAGPGDAGEHEVGERDDGGKPHAGAATEQPLCP